MTPMKHWLPWVASMTLGLGACSADVAPAPAPSLDTVGAFVAVDEGEEALGLYRTLAVLGDGSSSDVLFMTRYGVAPQTYEEASAFAKRRDLPASEEVTLLGKGYFDRHDWRVVWFRSLSYEEQAGFR
jgi:hypothetical protein